MVAGAAARLPRRRDDSMTPGRWCSAVAWNSQAEERAMFSTILVPLDGSDLARRALPYAAALAKATHARLVLLHAYVPGRTDTPEDPELDTIMELSDLAGDLREQGINASTWLVYDEAGPAIVEAVGDLSASLVVMSTHGRGGLSRLLHGSVAEYLLRQVSVPVVLVTSQCRPRWPTGSQLTIIVPLDGSAFAEEALQPARELAGLLHAEVVLLHAIEPNDIDDAPVSLAWTDAGARLLARARGSLEEAAGPLRMAGLSVELLTEVGEPASAIARIAAERNPAFVMMATHGRGALSRLVLESVSMEALQHLHAPILLVRPTSPAGEGNTESRMAERVRA